MKRLDLGLICVSLLLVVAMLANLAGCTKQEETQELVQNLMSGVYAHLVEPLEKDDMKNYSSAINRFSMQLFKESNMENENSVISPLSVLFALAMIANGANGETLKQMEAVLGISTAELNHYLYSYIDGLPDLSMYGGNFELANSIWFSQDKGFTPKQEFLQTNADYYGAELYNLPFNEESISFMNRWVENQTNGMIPQLVDTLDPNAVMVLMNALAFEAQWMTPYEKDEIRTGVFTKEDQTKQDAQFMYRDINGTYLKSEKLTGFTRRFCDYRYSFIALLPNEGVSVSECLSNLDGKSLVSLIDSGVEAKIDTAIPQFETEFSVNMSDVLKNMGMESAFGDKADFGNLGECSAGKLYISNVAHKATIKVNEKGVVAGAGTEAAMGIVGVPEEQRKVYLDRPFIYILYDSQNDIPLFIGTMIDINE